MIKERVISKGKKEKINLTPKERKKERKKEAKRNETKRNETKRKSRD